VVRSLKDSYAKLQRIGAELDAAWLWQSGHPRRVAISRSRDYLTGYRRGGAGHRRMATEHAPILAHASGSISKTDAGSDLGTPRAAGYPLPLPYMYK